MMHPRFDALIIGAGPAGCTAAILLARAGWSVAVVEKKPFPRRKVCGECVAASNFPLLEALGVGDALQPAGGPELRRLELMQRGHTVLADLPSFADARYPWGRALPREILDTRLLEQARAAGAVVLQPWSAKSLGGSRGDFRCQVRAVDSAQHAELRAALVIDAHGSWEPLKSPGGSAPRRRRGELLAFKANFSGVRLTDGALAVLSFSGGYGGMVMSGQGVATVACCVRADRLGRLRRDTPGRPAGDVVGAMLERECAGVAQTLRGARRVGAWLAAGPLRPGIRLASDDGSFRIGNAAAEAHPIIGEGMSMAIQSAWLLCAELLRGAAGTRTPADLPAGMNPAGMPPAGMPPAAKLSPSTHPAWPRAHLADAAWQAAVNRRYAARWRAHFAPRLRLASLCAHLAMRPRLSAPLVPLLEHCTALLRQGAVWSGKVRGAPAERAA